MKASQFLALAALVGLAFTVTSAQNITDGDILTFAYNLEVLEGQFYSCAATGKPLNSSFLGGGGAPSSCQKANLSSTVGTYAAELAREEAAHVELLYTSLVAAGAKPVAPAVNIDTAFEAAAEAAFGSSSPLNPIFNPYGNDAFFLHAAFIFEDLGASGYLGALSLIQDPAYRLVGGQIGNAESYHSSLIRTLLFQQKDTVPAYNTSVTGITTAIVAVLNKLTGTPQLKYNIVNDQGAQIANVDAMGLIPSASASQVLAAVTLGAPKGQGGGFFPQNLVGNLKN